MVKIYSQKRIDGAKFLVDKVELGEFQSEQMMATDNKEEFDVNRFAKEILIKGPRGKLSLAEVQVWC